MNYVVCNMFLISVNSLLMKLDPSHIFSLEVQQDNLIKMCNITVTSNELKIISVLPLNCHLTSNGDSNIPVLFEYKVMIRYHVTEESLYVSASMGSENFPWLFARNEGEPVKVRLLSYKKLDVQKMQDVTKQLKNTQLILRCPPFNVGYEQPVLGFIDPTLSVAATIYYGRQPPLPQNPQMPITTPSQQITPQNPTQPPSMSQLHQPWINQLPVSLSSQKQQAAAFFQQLLQQQPMQTPTNTSDITFANINTSLPPPALQTNPLMQRNPLLSQTILAPKDNNPATFSPGKTSTPSTFVPTSKSVQKVTQSAEPTSLQSPPGPSKNGPGPITVLEETFHSLLLDYAEKKNKERQLSPDFEQLLSAVKKANDHKNNEVQDSITIDCENTDVHYEQISHRRDSESKASTPDEY